jgi:hypothetical protein
MFFISGNIFHNHLCNVFCNFFRFPLVRFRDAVTASFLGVTHLICYFHVVRNYKEKLQSYSKDVQQDVLQDVHKLHSLVPVQECNTLMTCFTSLVDRSGP